MDDFNFEYWANLFKENPDEFYRQRNALIESEATRLCENEEKRKQVITKVHNANMWLDRIHNPTERLNQVQVMFWKQFDEFRSVMVDFQISLIEYSGILKEREEGKSKAAIHVVAEYGKLLKDK